MCSTCDDTIHGRHHHVGWDHTIPPDETLAPGESVCVECLDSSGGQLSKDSTTADLGTLPFDQINPVTGPIWIDGAKPGDVLKVKIESSVPSGWGRTAKIPGFGLLADQFEDPVLNIWSYDPDNLAPALFSTVAKVPLKPFAGTIGLAPAEVGLHSVVPPRCMGGNMDIRALAAGTTLYLPVEVEGAPFSVGDTHAAQGDGEVCGTAIESPMDVSPSFDLIEDTPLKFPRFTAPVPVTRHLDQKGYEVTTGIGPDLMSGACHALSAMVDLISARLKLSAVEAYILCSVCGDLRISEIVDMPNWVVSLYLPRMVFE